MDKTKISLIINCTIDDIYKMNVSKFGNQYATAYYNYNNNLFSIINQLETDYYCIWDFDDEYKNLDNLSVFSKDDTIDFYYNSYIKTNTYITDKQKLEKLKNVKNDLSIKDTSIPKIIHYCWISGEENMPDDIKACIESWKKYLPDYEFINWNDSNFDWNISNFTKYCRENNLYAFCADYIRFWALYNYGGIYLDSDVMVYKSFDELLKLNRIITKELLYQDVGNFEAAILGCRKNDPVFGDILNWYNNIEDYKWSKDKFELAPYIMKQCLSTDKYLLNEINNIDNEVLNNDVINILNCDIFFDLDGDNCFAQHMFKASWLNKDNKIQTTGNCLNNDKFKIFLCAHKDIENYIPKSKKYVIIDISGKIKNDDHEVIDISQDEFTKTHNICYSEGCAMRYLYYHPELIPDYICFGHYRRYFLDFIGKEKLIPRVIDNYGAIIKSPLDHKEYTGGFNGSDMYYDHFKDDVDAFIMSIKEAAPEYWDTFKNELFMDDQQYGFNCFAMKKEDFLEMCEMCFTVLSYFDNKMNYTNNEDVYNKVIENVNNHISFRYDIQWQSRVEAMFLEWLTELYYRKKFGVDNCYKSEAWYINEK